MNVQKSIVTSANWDSGRGGHVITGIVLHTMVGTTPSAYARFNDPSSSVSVHYGVSLDGSIHQWVEEANTAWQAGNYSVNQTTIGIEHEDNGNAGDSVRTEAEYESSSDLVADICKRYNIPCDTTHILLHKNVIDTSRYPGGTACPDGLDTNKIISMAQAKIGEEMTVQPGDVKYLFNRCLGINPTQADYDWAVGKTWDVYVKAVLSRPEATVQKGDVSAFFAQLIGTPPTTQDYAYGQSRNFRQYIYAVLSRPDCADKRK